MSTSEEPLLTKNNARTLFLRNAHDAASLKKAQRFLQKEWKSEEKLFQKQREHILQRQSHLVEERSPKPKHKELILPISTQLLPEPPATILVTRPRGKTFCEADNRSTISEAIKTSLPTLSIPAGTEQVSPSLTKRAFVSRSKTFSAVDLRGEVEKSRTALPLPLSANRSSSAEHIPTSPPRSPRSWRAGVADSARTLNDNSSPSQGSSLPQIHSTKKKTNHKKQGGETLIPWKGSKSFNDNQALRSVDDLQGMRDCRYLRCNHEIE